MSYRALLNGVEFFNTSSSKNDLKLMAASVEYTAGAAGQFTFTVPYGNVKYDRFHPDNTRFYKDFLDVYKNDKIIFSSRVTGTTLNFDLSINVVSEGILAIFNDTSSDKLINDIDFPTTLTMKTMMEYVIGEHNAQVGDSMKVEVEYITDDSETALSRNDLEFFVDYGTTYSRLSDLVAVVDGYCSLRKEASDGKLYFTYRSQNDLPSISHPIELGTNLISLTYSKNTEELVTCITPFDGDGYPISPRDTEMLDYIDSVDDYNYRDYNYSAADEEALADAVNGIFYFDLVSKIPRENDLRTDLVKFMVMIKKMFDEKGEAETQQYLRSNYNFDQGEADLYLVRFNIAMSFVAPTSDAISVYIPSAVKKYGRICQTITFDEISYEQHNQLAVLSKRYLDTYTKPEGEARIEVVDMANLGIINGKEYDVAYKIRVNAKPHSLEGHAVVCTNKNANLLDPSSDQLTFISYKRKRRL